MGFDLGNIGGDLGAVGGFLVGGPVGAAAGYGVGSNIGGGGGGSSGGGGAPGMGSAGSSGTPGLFGQGMYQAPNYGIQPGAFNNPGYQQGQYTNESNNYLGNTTKPVVAQQSAPGDYSTFNSGVAGEQGLADKYAAMAAGNGPSQAEVTARQQGAANLAANESMLGSTRGAGNPAAAQLAARNAQAAGAQQVAGNAVAGRTAEEMGALGAQGSLYGNIAGQGLGQVGAQQNNSQFNAGQGNAVAMGNQGNTLAANTNLLGSTGNMALAQQQGTIAGQQLPVQQQLGLGQIGAGAYENAAKSNQAIVGGVANGIGGLLSSL